MDQGTRHQMTAAGLALAVGAGMLLGAAAVWSADAADASRSSRPSRAGTAKTAAAGDLDLSDIEEKLDEILSGQQAILKKFDAVMEELRIIKVRATLRGGS